MYLSLSGSAGESITSCCCFSLLAGVSHQSAVRGSWFSELIFMRFTWWSFLFSCAILCSTLNAFVWLISTCFNIYLGSFERGISNQNLASKSPQKGQPISTKLEHSQFYWSIALSCGPLFVGAFSFQYESSSRYYTLCSGGNVLMFIDCLE